MSQQSLLLSMASQVDSSAIGFSVVSVGSAIVGLLVVIYAVGRFFGLVGGIPRQKSLKEYEEYLRVERIKEKARIHARVRRELKAERGFL